MDKTKNWNEDRILELQEEWKTNSDCMDDIKPINKMRLDLMLAKERIEDKFYQELLSKNKIMLTSGRVFKATKIPYQERFKEDFDTVKKYIGEINNVLQRSGYKLNYKIQKIK